jgi:hypothetical protein
MGVGGASGVTVASVMAQRNGRPGPLILFG